MSTAGLLSAKVESEEAARSLLHSLCFASDGQHDEYFVDALVAELSGATGDSEVVAYLAKPTNKSALKTLCQRLGQCMDRCSELSDLDWRIIVLISLLASKTPLRLTTDESRKWIAFLTKTSFVDAITLKTALATLLACPNLMPDQASFKMDDQMERSLVDFFRRIHCLMQSANYNSLSNMMILVYVHLITDNGAELASLLSSVLGRKVPKTLHKQPLIKGLYISHAILEQDVAEKAANISITKDLCAHTSGYLPVHCISHLLHWRAFSKYSTPIQEWIKSQLRECRAPVHPMVATMLDNFASSCIPTENFSHYNKPIDEPFFEELFSGDIFDQSRLVLRLVSLTYLVAYTYKLDTSLPQRDPMVLGQKESPKPYSAALWKSIPIRYLLIMVDQRHADFQHIRPTLLRYLVMTMPHLLPEQTHFDTFRSSHRQQLNVGAGTARTSRAFSASVADISGALDEAVNSHNFCRFSRALTFLLEHATVEQQFPCYDVILRAMAQSLEGQWPRAVLDKLVSVWERFDSIVPRRLHEDTIRRWLSLPKAAKIPQLLSERDNDFLVAHTPLILFRADARVFRSPPHLRCFCRTLAFYLATSRDANTLRMARAAVLTSTKNEVEEKEGLLRSFIGTQRLAVVQTFIELCDDDSSSAEEGDKEELEEIRGILCSQIHQFFIADMHLPKLVHFNMYPLRLVPLIVRRVPSAHVLINAIGELITGACLERRIFAILLAIELLKQYKIPSAFAVLTLISDLLDTMLASVVSDEFIVLMLNIVPCLAELVVLSPFHAEHFLATMERTRKLTQSRLAVYTSITRARTSPEQKLLQLLNKTLEDLPKVPPPVVQSVVQSQTH